MADKLVSREIHLMHRPTGFVTEQDFETVHVELPELREGGFLVRNIWMSVDPHMRIFLAQGTRSTSAYKLNRPLSGGCVGQIIGSKSDKFKEGDYVLADNGWREYWISNDNANNSKDVTVIDRKIGPIKHFLGLLGITGFAAYVGLFKIGGLRGGMDTEFVSAAAGGVGSVACQIAKIKACHVVGSAGTEDKVKWLLDDVKIDYAFNYKKLGEPINTQPSTNENNHISSELKRACPNGIDLYFDNVGGNHLEAAIDNMSLFGRIVLCGATSVYDSIATTPNSRLPSGPSNLSLAISNRLRLQGFVYSDHNNMLSDFYQSMSNWISEDKIRLKETIYNGLESAPKAFVGLFKGENIGRTLVKIGSEI
jgi:NADPH-dependent curcumin reductase CurA